MIDRFYFDRFLDSPNVNEQDRVASTLKVIITTRKWLLWLR